MCIPLFSRLALLFLGLLACLCGPSNHSLLNLYIFLYFCVF